MGTPIPPPADPMVAQASQLISEMFRQVRAHLPNLLQAQQPGGSPLPQFTESMLQQLQEQLDRALGLPPVSSAAPQPLRIADDPAGGAQAEFGQEVRRQMDLALAALTAPTSEQ